MISAGLQSLVVSLELLDVEGMQLPTHRTYRIDIHEHIRARLVIRDWLENVSAVKSRLRAYTEDDTSWVA